MSHRRPADDLRPALDDLHDDDDLLQDVAERTRGRGDAGAPLPAAPPLRDGEVVCRRCRLVVPRRTPEGVVQLLCDDCRW